MYFEFANDIPKHKLHTENMANLIVTTLKVA